jgi:hypothetical protein
MTDRGVMMLRIDRVGRPELPRGWIVAELHGNVAHLIDMGWTFPKIRGRETSDGTVVLDPGFAAGELSPPLSG